MEWIGLVELLVNGIANTPTSFGTDLDEIRVHHAETNLYPGAVLMSRIKDNDSERCRPLAVLSQCLGA